MWLGTLTGTSPSCGHLRLLMRVGSSRPQPLGVLGDREGGSGELIRHPRFSRFSHKWMDKLRGVVIIVTGREHASYGHFYSFGKF